MFRNRFKTNQNEKSVFRNKPKLKIYTLLCNVQGVDIDMDMEMDTETDTIYLFRFGPKLDLFRSFSRN